MKKLKAFLVIMIAVLCSCSTVFAERKPTIRPAVGTLEEEYFYEWNNDPDNIECYKQAYDKVMEAIRKNPAEYSDAISLAGISWMSAYSNEVDKFEEYSQLFDDVLDSILCLPKDGADYLAEATIDFFWMCTLGTTFFVRMNKVTSIEIIDL